MLVVCVDFFGLFFHVVGVQLPGEKRSVAPVIVLSFLFPLPPGVRNNTERWLESNRQESPARHWTEQPLCVKRNLKAWC